MHEFITQTPIQYYLAILTLMGYTGIWFLFTSVFAKLDESDNSKMDLSKAVWLLVGGPIVWAFCLFIAIQELTKPTKSKSDS